jgi:UDP-N-acetylmuramoylalanine--D-glutamate ligase
MARSAKARPPLPPGSFLVVGLARSGQAVTRMLRERGEEVLGSDSGSPRGAEGLQALGVEIHLDGDGVGLLDRVRCVVKSPGVPGSAAVIQAARDRGIDVVGELELAWRALPNAFVGVTGTNGKTTVTELCGHIWREAGEPVAVAGNVGTPLSALVGEVDPEATVICECSSFQLEDADAFSPECAVLLNIAPDHLDRHGDIERYAAAKLRIFANQTEGDTAVIDPQAGLEPSGHAERLDPNDAAPLVDEVDLKLRGEHGRRNALAAASAARAMGIEPAAVRAALESFTGLPHRLEVVREIGGVQFVNDSKATNVAAAVAALRAFRGGVHAILGGSSKGEAFEPLAEPVRERCAAAYLIGETATEIERALVPTGVALQRCDGLADAVTRAAGAAGARDVVLLAPACASFDAFADYAERGDTFRKLVEELTL